MIIPSPLKPGDRIAILSPASAVNPEYVSAAAKTLRAQGYFPEIMPHACGKCGSYSATETDRLADIAEAFTRKDIRAILCSRGGYGCVHLLPHLAKLPLVDDPKWLIGFSDVSALHQLMASKGIVSIHGSMAKALALHPADFETNAALLRMLGGDMPEVKWPTHPLSLPGTAEGTLRGGNLAVIQALIDTPFHPFVDGQILFIEDIAEPIYKVERILCQLRMSGILQRSAGIVIGQFTEYRPDANHSEMYSMISPLVSDLGIPVAFNAPIGHIEENMPLLHGAPYRLAVAPNGSLLSPQL